jgi:sporulation protein YlmC with PRC-barrel domain
MPTDKPEESVMNKFVGFTMASLLGLSLVGVADAQQQQQREQTGTQQQREQTGAQQQREREQVQQQQQRQPMGAQQAGDARGFVAANSIIGAEVRSQQGEDMGRIEQLLIDPQDGKVAYAVVGRGGFLGMGRDHVQVRWDDLSVRRDRNDVVVTMDQEVLRQAPRAERDDRTPAALPRGDRDRQDRQQPQTQPGTERPAPGTGQPRR